MRARRHALDASLARRQAMGVTRRAAHPRLPHYLACLERHQATCITTARAVQWATHPRHVPPADWARRLRLGRGCAQYHTAIAPRTASPPPPRRPSRPQRHPPYR